MDKYAIRVDIIGYDDTHKRMQQFLDPLTKYLVYEEVATKTKKLHLQGIVFYEGREKDLRASWDTIFPNDPWEAKKLKKKSLSKVRNDNYEIYITKDENLKYNKNYSEEEIINLFKQSYKKEEEKENKRKNVFFETVIEKWDESRMCERLKQGRGDRDEIKTWLLETFYSLSKLWDTPVITKYTNFLEYRSNKQQHIKAFLESSRDRY